MRNTHSRSVQVFVLVAVLTLTGCLGKLRPTAVPTATTVPPTATAVPPTATLPPTPTPTPDARISSLEGVRSAVIYIEAQGAFAVPGVGLQVNSGGSGSGFIIHESGLAVTNNHVVTGAALLRVWIGGEGEPRNAKVLGVSECSDLAVIDIDGDGFPYLEWYDGQVSAGLDIYAAGFPLGDPEYTLTRGIVAKERASGETSWASVDSVIQHDASTNPGSSGGPIVTGDGKVVAVHYAGNSDTIQQFAIGRNEALKVIDEMRAGRDVNSVGVNGTAFITDEGLSGIWVSSVESGSPADGAGVKGGDIIIRLEGLILSKDGTMSDYCDILRSHSASDTLKIEVYRTPTGERLEGQLNGRALEVVSIPVVPTPQTAPGQPSTAAYSGYVLVTDDFGVLQVEVPQEWSDVDGSPWVRNGQEIGASVAASSDLEGFVGTFTTPGVFFGASRVLLQEYDVNTLLDNADFSDECTYDGRYEYDDGVYVGFYDLYTDCGSVQASIISTAAMPESGAFIVWVLTQVVTEADIDAFSQIVDTFDVVGNLP